MQKYLSRKFIISAAAFLASFGAGLTGVFTQNEVLGSVGFVCVALSAGLYSASEAYVDGKSASSTTTQTTISASTTAKDVVVSAMNREGEV